MTASRMIAYPFTTEEVIYHHYGENGRTTTPPVTKHIPIEAYTPLFEIHTPNSDGSRKQWKSYEHYKTHQVSPGANCGWELTGGTIVYPTGYWKCICSNPWVGYYKYGPYSHDARYGDQGQLDGGLPRWYVPAADGSIIPPPADLAGLTRRALSTMLPIIKAELSVPNFILELKDFKRPVNKVVEFAKSPYIRVAMKQLLRAGLKNQSWQQLLRTAAGQYLNYKFNLRPLISDISSIYTALSRTERRINDFITRAGKPQNKHFAYKWQEFDNDVDDLSEGGTYDSYFAAGATCGCQRQVFVEPSVFHAQVQYNYNYTAYQVVHARLLATLDALGVNFNPAIIWNAIPWSFTIDWVLGVSRWLDSMKNENMKPQINIRRFLWSIYRERRIVVTKGVRNVVPNGGWIQNQLPVVYQTAYRRKVGLPASSSFTTSGLNAEEFSLGAALVIARRRRPNNRR